MPGRHSSLWRWGLIVGALAALLLLAAGLSAPVLPQAWTTVDSWAGWPAGSATGGDPWLGKILIGAGLILMLTLAVANLLLASRRKRPLPAMNFSLLSIVLVLLIIAVLRPEILERLQVSRPPPAPLSGTPAPGAAAPPVPGALPVVLVYGISLAAAVLLVLIGWVVWQSLRRRKLPADMAMARQVAHLAQAALADWQSGTPLGNVIVRCYREMSELVAEKRAVQRPADMTPHEFVEQLRKAGVPVEPAAQLTVLFEVARYSTRPLGAAEEAAARACLKALAEALEAPA